MYIYGQINAVSQRSPFTLWTQRRGAGGGSYSSKYKFLSHIFPFIA